MRGKGEDETQQKKEGLRQVPSDMDLAFRRKSVDLLWKGENLSWQQSLKERKSGRREESFLKKKRGVKKKREKLASD